jgi:hypothetical protein
MIPAQPMPPFVMVQPQLFLEFPVTQLSIGCWLFNVGCFLRFRFYDCEDENEGRGRFPKTISPCPTFRSNRDKWGMGVCQALFPMLTLGAHPCGGCQLPDAILHGKRSYRPRSRAVQCLAAAGFRVRLFSLLGPMVAPPACKPGQDTPAIFFRVLTISTGSAAVFDSAFAPCHGSRLFTLRLHFTHSPAVSF